MDRSPQPDKSHRHMAENLRLYQGGQAYFPALIAAIDSAKASVQMETYLFDVYGAGADVADALIRAAQIGRAHV